MPQIITALAPELSASGIDQFRNIVLEHYRLHGRLFSWRQTRDAWCILVSEVMLQQTQTQRVAPKYAAWLERFPDARALASAPLADVYDAWQGLGYNRRALRLRDCARLSVDQYQGQPPDDEAALLAMPGIGRYTARAIRCFAYDRPAVFLETNIRAAIIFHFFRHPDLLVKDKALEAVADLVLDRVDPRTWYYALMDYGAWLKKTVPNPGRRSTTHVRQSTFAGSRRQARGAVLRALADIGPASIATLAERSGLAYPRMDAALSALVAEGLVRYEAGVACFAE